MYCLAGMPSNAWLQYTLNLLYFVENRTQVMFIILSFRAPGIVPAVLFALNMSVE